MAKDYTKYSVEGVGENFNKRKLVFEIVKDYVNKNKLSLEELKNIFPDNLEGTNGSWTFICKESDVKDAKRFNMKEPLTIKNGVHIVVSNQWGAGNLPLFISIAEKLGYSINNNQDSEVTNLIDITKFEPWELNEFYKTFEDNDEMLNKIDQELESLLDKDFKYYGYASIFQAQFGFEYYREEIEDFYTISKNPNDLLEMLQDEPLLTRIINKHNIGGSLLEENNIEFRLLFIGYFTFAIQTLIELDDEELIAEFICRQSTSTIEDDFEVDTPEGDWISDLCIDILKYNYNIDLSNNYDDGCSINGNHFGQYYEMGYDYLSASRDIIDSMI